MLRPATNGRARVPLWCRMLEHFSRRLFGSDAAARAARNKRAKQLRALGHRVACSVRDFSGFGYGREYVLEWVDPTTEHVEGRPRHKRKIDTGVEPDSKIS